MRATAKSAYYYYAPERTIIHNVGNGVGEASAMELATSTSMALAMESASIVSLGNIDFRGSGDGVGNMLVMALPKRQRL